MSDMILKTLIAIIIAVIYGCGVKFVFQILLKDKADLGVKFLKSFLLILGFAVIIYGYLSQFDATKEMSKTLLESGSLIIAVATFSCQKVLNNIISGIMISSAKPFNIGDKITLLNNSAPIVTGVVMDINARHTAIQLADGRCALIANNLVDSYVCINENTLENNGYPLVMECSYDSDVELAMQLMQQEIERHPLTIQVDLAQSKVTCSNLSPNGFELKAIVFTNNIADNVQACSDLRIRIFKAWQAHEIKVPHNVVDVAVKEKNESRRSIIF